MENLSILPLQQGMMPEASEQIADATMDFGQFMGLTGPVLSILGGLAILIIGYFVAKLVGKMFSKFLKKLGVDKSNTSKTSISEFGGKLIYYLLMIIVLMATLSMMGVSGEVLAPLNNMTSEFLGAIPNIVGAGLIAYIGYFLGKIVAGLVETSGE